MKYYFSINLSRDEFLPYYRGEVHSIVVTTTVGTTVKFPAMHLRQHMTSCGVFGHFCLETKNNKFLSLIKIS